MHSRRTHFTGTHHQGWSHGKVISLFVFTFVGIVMLLLPVWADDRAESTSPPSTLLYKSESDESLGATSEARQSSSLSQVPPAQVSIFYPTRGQSTSGACWMGVTIDRHDNVYPINSYGFYKILPDGTLVNGVSDQNLFASGPSGEWGELDEGAGKLYTVAGTPPPSPNGIYSAPFLEGSTFSILISGLDFGGGGIVLGEGPLAGSLFVTDGGGSASQGPGRVSRVTLSPLNLSVFANGPFFNFPEAIASAPDGTLYMVNLGFHPTQLTKITPAGVPSIFLTGTDPQVNRALAVDDAGNVYWSHATGMNKYDVDGNFLGTLPGPPDKPAYGNPMGAAFDSRGNLYLVDNFGCKKIYKYTIAPQADTIPPVITVSASPTTLWPPNGKLVPVTVSGAMTDEPGSSGVNASSAAYVVMDEYGQIQPRGSLTFDVDGRYAVTVVLEASRKGNDHDGRHYTIAVSANDNAGNLGVASTIVTVPHDRGK